MCLVVHLNRGNDSASGSKTEDVTKDQDLAVRPNEGPSNFLSRAVAVGQLYMVEFYHRYYVIF